MFSIQEDYSCVFLAAVAGAEPLPEVKRRKDEYKIGHLTAVEQAPHASMTCPLGGRMADKAIDCNLKGSSR